MKLGFKLRFKFQSWGSFHYILLPSKEEHLGQKSETKNARDGKREAGKHQNHFREPSWMPFSASIVFYLCHSSDREILNGSVYVAVYAYERQLLEGREHIMCLSALPVYGT